MRMADAEQTSHITYPSKSMADRTIYTRLSCMFVHDEPYIFSTRAWSRLTQREICKHANVRQFQNHLLLTRCPAAGFHPANILKAVKNELEKKNHIPRSA